MTHLDCSPIHCDDEDRKIIESILESVPYVFFAYGSRIKGSQRQYSDLDLCYKEAVSFDVIGELEEKFVQSDLPFKVELVDWNSCSKDFQELISEDLVPLRR